MKIFSGYLVRLLGLLVCVFQTSWVIAEEEYSNDGLTVPKPSFQLGDNPSRPYPDGSPDAKAFVEFFNKTYLKNSAQIDVLNKDEVVWFPPQNAGDTSLELVGRLTPNEKALLTPEQIAESCNDPDEYPIICEEGFNTGEFCRACHDSVLFVEGGGLQEMAYFSKPDFTAKHQIWIANWSQYGDWSSNIMRLATRDPIWQAQIETETNTHPYADPAAIQDVCFSCHGEMGERQLKFDHGMDQVFCTDLFYATIPGTLSKFEHGKPYPYTGDCEPIEGKPIADNQALYAKYGSLARDGVSCETCHRIGPEVSSDKNGSVNWDGKDFSVFYGPEHKYDVQERQTENPQPLQYEFTATFDYNMDYVLTPDAYAELNSKPMKVDDNLKVAQAWNKEKDVSYLRQGVLCGACHVLIVPQIPTAFKPGAPLPDTTEALKQQFPYYKKPDSCKRKTFAKATNGIYGNPITDECVAFGYEQTTYLEWINSSFASESDNDNTCQGCHMPFVTKPGDLADHTAIMAQTTQGLKPKSYRRHRLMGINLPVFEMFMQFPDVLGVEEYDYLVPESGTANTSQSKQSADFIQNYLLNGQTAIVEQATSQANGNGLVGNGIVKGSSDPDTPNVAATEIRIDKVSFGYNQLQADITIVNNTGHKFPSGAGFRRAFIKFEVLDAKGGVLWVSGQTNPYGAICDGECVAENGMYNLIGSEMTAGDPSRLQPHHSVISREDQVQIYEIQEVNDTGVLTSSTLSLFHAAKDNRILPKGFKSPKELGCSENAKGKPIVTGDSVFGITQCSASYATQAVIDPLTIGSTIAGDRHYTDSNFAGSDVLSYQIPWPDDRAAPHSVRVTMEYQTIPPAYLAARFQQGYDQDAQQHLTATQRIIYLTSHLNTNLKLKSEHPDNPDLVFSKNWTTSIYQAEAPVKTW